MSIGRILGVIAPIVIVLGAIAAISRQNAEKDVLVKLHRLSPQELETGAFALASPQSLRIEAVGAGPVSAFGDACCDADQSDDAWVGNAWILDAATREVVWELRSADTERRGDGVREFEGTIELPAGQYIVHYSSFTGDPVTEAACCDEGAKAGRRDDVSDDFRITIRGTGDRMKESDIALARERFSHNAFVSFIGLDDEAIRRIAFTVSEPIEAEIYAIGEGDAESAYDYAWVINADTREIVWKLGSQGLKHAGGAGRNRMERARIMLDAGSYAAFAVTDGSHDASDWDAPAPYDPEFWGLTLRTIGEQTGKVATHPYRLPAPKGSFVSLIGLGDDELASAGFALSQPFDVRVYAVGEGSGGEMYDYGWIVDASTRRTVWQMDYEATEHAGGSEKNRMVDQVITLEPGKYVVYYVTDGSHSWSDWNSSPPMDQDAWGITLLAPSGAVDTEIPRAYDMFSDPSIIAQLTGIGDDERRSHQFTLDDETEIRIYALGEGSGGDMDDFAWIESAATGRAVWEMTYRTSEHAGGAEKNRLFDGTLMLPTGEYVLRYESDGSHSLEDWNAEPPDDPASYGVTVYRGR
jgi:hypothetical protein